VDSRVYFDNSASAPVRPEVFEAMLPYLRGGFGNPSSLHEDGRAARAAVDDARQTVADTLGAEPGEIVFTSGGTESDNLALKGVAFANFDRGRHIIVSAVEHDAVLNSARWLAEVGFEVTVLPVDPAGLVDTAALAGAVRSDTVLVSIMHANNEIGTIEPIAELGAECRQRGVYFHTDACQSFTLVPLDLHSMPVDLVSINGHKIGGPKGVGALYVRRGVRVAPWQHGGGHEHGLRSSTENLPGIVGLALAARLGVDELEAESSRLAGLRDRIIDFALENLPGAYLNGHRARRLPNNVSLGFDGLEGEAIKLLLELDKAGISVSSGSACSTHGADSKPSRVLTAIGRDPIRARGALRISLGRQTTPRDVDRLLAELPSAIGRLRPIMSFAI
jgi:cysteine desulfurase